jgi:type IV fimbrial biogenesis protein FimT
MLISQQQRGVTLIEIMVTLVIAGVIGMLALPAFQTMMANARTKASAESILSGLRKAKAEAIKRNMPVRFQLVSSLANGCAYSTSSMLWLVTETDQLATGDPVPDCGDATVIFSSPGDIPSTVQVSSNGASIVTFSPVGQVLTNMGGAVQLARVDVTSTNADATPWRILVSPGGSIKMCNAGTAIAAGNPLKCP